jgi:hypothetical protein
MVKIQFCANCHKVKKIGKWVAIDDKMEKHLRTNYGKWEASIVVCPDCSLKDFDEKEE